MAKITYIQFSGAEYVLDIAPGLSVMQGAVANDVRRARAGLGPQSSNASGGGQAHTRLRSP